MEFRLTSKEEEEAKQFFLEHKECSYTHLSKPFFSTTGGQFTFLITPTGLGNMISVRCNICDEMREITDVSDW